MDLLPPTYIQLDYPQQRNEEQVEGDEEAEGPPHIRDGFPLLQREVAVRGEALALGKRGADGGDGWEASFQVVLQVCGLAHPRPKPLGSYISQGSIGQVSASPVGRHAGHPKVPGYSSSPPLRANIPIPKSGPACFIYREKANAGSWAAREPPTLKQRHPELLHLTLAPLVGRGRDRPPPSCSLQGRRNWLGKAQRCQGSTEPPGSVPGTWSSRPARTTARAADGKPCGDAAVAAGKRPRGVSRAPRKEQFPRILEPTQASLCCSSLLCRDTELPGHKAKCKASGAGYPSARAHPAQPREDPAPFGSRMLGFTPGSAKQSSRKGQELLLAPLQWQCCSLKAVSMPGALYGNPSSPSAGHEEATVLMDHATAHARKRGKPKQVIPGVCQSLESPMAKAQR